MRINLQCPFQDKDLARQRGARWDPRLRVWYVQDVADLGPFAAWLPRAASGAEGLAAAAQRAVASLPSASRLAAQTAITTRPATAAQPGCACAVLPWEDCECTRARVSAGT